jgi:hypothetical protein
MLFFSKKDGVYSSAFSAPLCVGGKALIVMDNSFLMDIAYVPEENYSSVANGKYYDEKGYIKFNLNEVKEPFVFKPKFWGGFQNYDGEDDFLSQPLYKYCFVYEAVILAILIMLFSFLCQALLFIVFNRKQSQDKN